MSPLKVWSKFSAKKDGAAVNLRIVDAPENLFEEVINHYMKYQVPADPICNVTGVLKSPAALEELRVTMLKAIKEEKGFHTVVCCLDNGDDQIKEIFGLSMMALTTKGDPEPEFDFKTDEIKKLLEVYYGVASYYDESKVLHSDRFFSDRGLFIAPEYEGIGVEQELLKSRRLICKEHGIPVNGAWLWTLVQQKAAESDGWETAFEIKLEELGKKLGVTFDDGSAVTKFMIAKIQ